MKFDAQKMIVRGGDIEEERRDWGFDRSKFLNASEAGDCIRRIWYGKQSKIKGEAQDWGFARRGHMVEAHIVRVLRAANVPLIWAGEDQVSCQDKDRNISATPDGIIDWGTSWEGLEIKSMDPRTNRSKLPKAAHVLQLQIAMELRAVDKPDGVAFSSGHLVYVDASNLHDVVQFEVQRDETVLDRMAKKATKVLRARKADTLEREGRLDQYNQCRLCQFKEPCGVAMDDASGRKRANRGSNMEAELATYLSAKEKETAAKAEKEAAAEGLRVELERRKTNKATIAGYNVTLTPVSGRASFNKKKAEKDGIDLSPYTTIGKASTRLNVDQTA